ncbi:mechanosensitive ion channel family protein [uncultured Erythrobacter sp.]|nr:mechanosensitive ion channel family protein [uncultured Erythrobacter sp.]
MAESLVASLPAMVIALIIIGITWAVAKGASRISARIIGKTELRPSLRNLVDTLVRLGVWLGGAMIAAIVVFPDFSPTSLIAGLGIGAVAIGFAFQDFFENFLAGVMIMLRDKMQIGDVIKSGDIHGKVEFISLRESHIRAFSGELHVLPNSMLFKDPVEVVTDLEERRFEVVIGVSYDTDLDDADAVIRKAVGSVDLVSKDKDIQVLADTFNSSSVDFVVRWWAASSGPDAVMNRDQVVRAIKRGLDEAGIEIPFPYITHTFKESVPMAEGIREAA